MTTEEKVQKVIQYCRLGQMALAEELCNDLLKEDQKLISAQWLLLEIYLSQKRHEQLLDTVGLIVISQSQSLPYVNEIATILVNEGEFEVAQKSYLRYLQAYPESAQAHYELAVLQKQSGLLQAALSSYKKSLTLNIVNPETVHVNIAVIFSELRQERLAKQHLSSALLCQPSHVPALFNLATLYEEWGKRENAIALYEKILKLEPNNIEVITRIINATKIVDSRLSLVEHLKKLLSSSKHLSQIDKEAGHFALGKAYDDCRVFDLAFHHYRVANEYCAQRSPHYDCAAHERYIQTIISTFNAKWIKQNTLASDYKPIFICGMFRSGTSLTEQILAAHSDVSSGGELSLLNQLIKNTRRSFPHDISVDKNLLMEISANYQTGIKKLFPNAVMVTDKRPDNFVYLGLLKAIFPNAKFICTIRNPLDVCLSVYFQHLGNELPYSNKLISIAQYYIQYLKLVRHWQQLMPDSILIMDYEKLVASQTDSSQQLLKFCGLPWQDQCLEFYAHNNAIKTASLWQVRQPMYQSSVHRFKNYADQLSEVETYLDKHLPLGYADFQ